MKAFKVNADYELELFHRRQGPPILGESLEFLAFFLTDKPIRSLKSYSPEYLDHVETITGHRPVTVKSGPYENWWGDLKNLEHEQWMNSKLTSTELAINEGWSTSSSIIKGPDDLLNFDLDRDYLLKDAFGMSGKGLRIIKNKKELAEIKKFPSILEPLLNRKFDFSHYYFPTKDIIAYQNLVDHKFQYRGTLLNEHSIHSLKQFKFYQLISETEWIEFNQALEKIISYYSQRPMTNGFSIDSFIYEESGKFKLHYLCEINYRRTMGSTAYELAKRYAKENPWCLLVLGRMHKPDFSQLLQKLKEVPSVMLMSPNDVRYQMFFLHAKNEQEGKRIFKELRALLPECQFAVNIED